MIFEFSRDGTTTMVRFDKRFHITVVVPSTDLNYIPITKISELPGSILPVLFVSTSQDSVSGTRHLVDLRSVSSVYLQSQAEVSRVDWIGNRRDWIVGCVGDVERV